MDYSIVDITFCKVKTVIGMPVFTKCSEWIRINVAFFNLLPLIGTMPASLIDVIFVAGKWWSVSRRQMKFTVSGFWSLRQTVTCCQYWWLHNNKITSLPWWPKYVNVKYSRINVITICTMHLLVTLSLMLMSNVDLSLQQKHAWIH